jgi:septum formation protein
MEETGPLLQAPPQLPPIWRGAGPLILASKSRSRLALLSAAGIDAEVVGADVDERAFEDQLLGEGRLFESLAIELARAKALAVSALWPQAYCLGADQTLTLEGRVIHKSRDFTQATQTIAALAGKTHRLTSAFCIARASQSLVVDEDHASLRMRPLDAATISRYLDRAGPSVLASVGAYQVEGLGAHLFDRINGDHSVILGLPMLKVLGWLRHKDLISL